jgi:hypothetical protein
LLPVPSLCQAKVDRAAAVEICDGDKEAFMKVCAVSGDRVDLVRGVDGSDVTAGRETACSRLDHDYVAVEPSPFALHADQASATVERNVVSKPFVDRAQHLEAEANGGGDDLRLRDCPLLVSRESVHACEH